MINSYVKQSLRTLRSNKWRSFLTMLGIIIGVTSVVTTVSLGEGVKKNVTNQIKDFGSDLIVVKPGKDYEDRASANSPQLDVTALFKGSVTSLSDDDLEAVSSAEAVERVAPLAAISGSVSYDNQKYTKGSVVATSSSFPNILNQETEFGEFLSDGDEGKNFAVIGKTVAEQLFKENVPVGKSIDFKGQRFIVKGVMGKFKDTPFNFGTNYNNTIFIPYITGKTLTGGSSQIFEIIAKPDDPKRAVFAKEQIVTDLKKARNGDDDFSVLTQDDNLSVVSDILGLVTGLVTAVAAISLIVGGVGVMNIMTLTVTERTREIGIRKAIGATRKQILGQFLSEAIVLSLVGGVLGVIFSFAVNIVLLISTDLTPVIAWPVIVASVFVSLVVGVIFGVAPALKASRKKPIDALRYQ